MALPGRCAGETEDCVVLGGLAAFACWLFAGLPLLERWDQMKWAEWMGNIPQWLTFLTAGAGFYFAYRQLENAVSQLRDQRVVRETENFLAIAESSIAHNAEFLKEDLRKNAIQMLEGLNVPPDASGEYWHFRVVHLGHVNMVLRAWELGGRPASGDRMNERFDGWERFAREIVMKKLRASQMAVETAQDLPVT